MNILIINAGSSSIKYCLYDMDGPRLLCSGTIEHINEAEAPLHHWHTPPATPQKTKLSVKDHRAIFEHLFQNMTQHHKIHAIGHRVVHGGEQFNQATRINDDVLQMLNQTIPLAPLHNPINIIGIKSARHHFPQLTHVAVFDTAFHHTLPEYAYRYALPETLYEQHHIRRYGFHGTSHQYLTYETARHLQKPIEQFNGITLHLGNGASIAAIQNGQCIDTSMGMTPLEGLIMGSRCGDIDAGVIIELLHRGYQIAEIDDLLNKESGLKGLCNDNDMRLIEQRAQLRDQAAIRAINLFCYRIKKYIGAYTAVIGHIDALVFSGGIGEHSSYIREQCCQGLTHLGFHLDTTANKNASGSLQRIDRHVNETVILMMRTQEELEIARQTQQLLTNSCNW